MLQQVVSHVGDCVRRKDLSSVHVEDVLLSSAMAAVMEVSKSLLPEVQSKFRADLEEFGRQLGELHYVSDLKKQSSAEQHLLLVLQGLGRIKSYFSDATIQAANVMAEQYVCPLHPETTGRRTELCPKCGRELEQQVRLIAGRTNGPYCSIQTVQAAIRTDGPLVVGRETKAFLTLTHLDGKPVFLTDLIEMHTRKVHLLLIDSGLADYHHEHPLPTLNPGEFEFAFTPRKPGSYSAWGDIRPAPMGLQEHAATVIQATTTGEPISDRDTKKTDVVDGLTYQLWFDQAQIRAGKPINGRLRIAREDGTGFNRLEPTMAAFAHLVGFHEDRRNALHFHPKGRPVLNEKDRGGPELEFVFYAPQPGFIRLFAQVQIEGVSRFASFGVEVSR